MKTGAQPVPADPPAISFIGTGLMGAPMARRLLDAGCLRTVWNRSPERARSLVDKGAMLVASPREAAIGADMICLCLTSAEAVEQVMFGPAGLASKNDGAAPLVIDFTTSSPTETRRIADRYRSETNGRWLDAPVSGGTARAASGDLIIFCGGEADAFAAAEPVLRILSRRASLVGPQGAGQTLKLCAQLIAAPTIVAIAEAFAAAEANGLDVARIPDLLSEGLADSPLLQLFGRRMAVQDPGPPIGAVATMLKDIDAATAMARKAGAPTPVAASAAEVYRALALDDGDHDLARLLDHYRGRAGLDR